MLQLRPDKSDGASAASLAIRPTYTRLEDENGCTAQEVCTGAKECQAATLKTQTGALNNQASLYRHQSLS